MLSLSDLLRELRRISKKALSRTRIYIYIYIYMEGERGREAERHTRSGHGALWRGERKVYIYIYIYIYMEGGRGELERGRFGEAVSSDSPSSAHAGK